MLFETLLFPDLIGLLGVAILLIAYVLLQIHIWSAKDVIFSFANAAGSAMILYSLYYDWNLSAFLMETIWVVMSVYGMVQAFVARRRLSKII